MYYSKKYAKKSPYILVFIAFVSLLVIDLTGKKKEKDDISFTELSFNKVMAYSGHPEYQYKLGRAYDKGLLVLQNNEVAIKWYKKAAKKKHPKAMTNLAYFYDQGLVQL